MRERGEKSVQTLLRSLTGFYIVRLREIAREKVQTTTTDLFLCVLERRYEEAAKVKRKR